MAADLKKIKESLSSLTLLEASTLVKELEEEWGVSAAAQAVAVAGPAAEAAEAKEEKTEFNVILEAVGDQKIAVIKAVRDITGAALGEAKGIVDSAPKAVKEGVSKDESEEIKKKLEAAGAKVKID